MNILKESTNSQVAYAAIGSILHEIQLETASTGGPASWAMASNRLIEHTLGSMRTLDTSEEILEALILFAIEQSTKAQKLFDSSPDKWFPRAKATARIAFIVHHEVSDLIQEEHYSWLAVAGKAPEPVPPIKVWVIG